MSWQSAGTTSLFVEEGDLYSIHTDVWDLYAIYSQKELELWASKHVVAEVKIPHWKNSPCAS